MGWKHMVWAFPLSHWFSVTTAWRPMTHMWELAGWFPGWIKGCWGCAWGRSASSPSRLSWPTERRETVSSALLRAFLISPDFYCDSFHCEPMKPTRPFGLDQYCPLWQPLATCGCCIQVKMIKLEKIEIRFLGHTATFHLAEGHWLRQCRTSCWTVLS